jgi:hypothetical protein
MSTTKLICQVGRETCSADLLAALMRSTEGAHMRLLKGMIRSGARREDILAVLRRADVVGGITPALRDAAIAAVIAEADRWRKRHAEELAREMAIRAGQPCHMSIANAYLQLIFTESEYEVLGGPPPRSPVLERALAACKDLPSHAGSPVGPRGASRPPQE